VSTNAREWFDDHSADSPRRRAVNLIDLLLERVVDGHHMIEIADLPSRILESPALRLEHEAGPQVTERRFRSDEFVSKAKYLSLKPFGLAPLVVRRPLARMTAGLKHSWILRARRKVSGERDAGAVGH
jgi:hypothetical protein